MQRREIAGQHRSCALHPGRGSQPYNATRNLSPGRHNLTVKRENRLQKLCVNGFAHLLRRAPRQIDAKWKPGGNGERNVRLTGGGCGYDGQNRETGEAGTAHNRINPSTGREGLRGACYPASGSRVPYLLAARSFDFIASSSRLLAGAFVSSERSSRADTRAISSTAAVNGASLAFEGLFRPLILRTNWSDAARISSSVAGGSKLNSILMFLHIRISQAKPDTFIAQTPGRLG